MGRRVDGDLAQARRTFFEWGGAPVGQVSSTILQSWRRCRQHGLDAQGRPTFEPVDAGRLREMRERHEKLWRLARAELELLARDAAATDSIVILTDADGWILDAEGSTGFLDKAGRVALMPGVCWGESSVGTNAVGTAIHEQRAVEVRGGEHYLQANRIISCSAAPIFDPYGQVVGVLDISGESSVPHVHALGLARLAVASIEHRYFESGLPDCELLRVHRDPSMLGTAREGLLAFRDGRLIAANQGGLELFGLDRSELGRASYESLFSGKLSQLQDEGELLSRVGERLFGHIDTPEKPRRARRDSAIRVTRNASQSPSDAPIFDAALDADMQRTLRVLAAGMSVIVNGETGCGKEVFARELHRRGDRADKPFVAVNCAALPEGLIESEPFGYEDGAFTGARKQGSPGLMRQADGGVLFLDEIGDMPLSLQPRLLRVLQERELTPLGGGKPVKLDFALVCATHCNLEEAVGDGRFRADLFYRISHHSVHLRPLRERADLPGLVAELWSRIGRGKALSGEAMERLVGYAWPGNLRQLVSCLRTMDALGEPGQAIAVGDLPGYLQKGPRLAASPSALARESAIAFDPDAGLDEVAEATMRAAVESCGGNIARAARKLGVSRSTLYRRLGSDPRIVS